MAEVIGPEPAVRSPRVTSGVALGSLGIGSGLFQLSSLLPGQSWVCHASLSDSEAKGFALPSNLTAFPVSLKADAL